MRRTGLCLLMAGLLLCAPLAIAASPYDGLLDAVDALNPNGLAQDVTFDEAGDWLSATVVQRGEIAPQFQGEQWFGLVYSATTGEPITWDDVFTDGDAAAERIAAIADETSYHDAYAEYNAITPVPRDSFTAKDGVFTVYYPAEQLSYVSGRSGAFSFYAYELDGLLQEGIPLTKGDPAQAKQVLQETLAAGALPAPLDAWTIGTSMATADEQLGLIDVPDIKLDAAVWHFEAPEMRKAAFLSAPDDDHTASATITGIYTERCDFSGLCTGIATKEDCIAALGDPAKAETIETADAYSRLPAGETLSWTGEGRTLSFHFVEGILQSITLS